MAIKRGFGSGAALIVAFGMGLGATGASAQEGGLSLDLNSVESVADGCRMTFVTDNATGGDLEQANVEVAVFDTDGAVTRLVVLNFGALGEGRRNVVQFELAGAQCDGISELLINANPECTGPGGAGVDCAAGLSATSRTGIAFGL